MSHTPLATMDAFLPLISTTDTKMRLSIGAKLLSFVLDTSNSIVCNDIGVFVDHLTVWLQSSNYKVVQMTLDILSELVGRMRADFQPYLPALLPHLLDKLEDSKEIIREKSSCLLLKLVDCEVVSLQNLFDRISPICFSHKNSNVREHMLYLLCTVLDTYGASSLSLSKLVPSIVKLLSDPNGSVRSTAFDTLCKIYKNVGEKLRTDLLKKNSVPANKLPSLMAKFDEIKAIACENGLPDTFQSLKLDSDETDRVNGIAPQSDEGSLLKSMSRPPITPSELSSISRSKLLSANKTNTNHVTTSTISSSQSGAINEETFEDSFEKVPTVHFYSGKELEETLRKCHDVLKNENEDWNKRVDCLKKIRSLLVAGATKYEEFFDYLNMLLPAFLASIKDLRSLVVREACITVAYLSKRLESKFDHFAESVLNSLINLIQNSKKIIASSGLVCIRFILRYTHTPRLIPIIANNLNSKSKDIRRACCEFINLILQTWPVHSLEKHANSIQEAIKKGIADADAEVRSLSRLAFAAFAQNFPEMAESLKNSLDFSYRKLLFANSNSGSSSSLSKFGVSGVAKSLPRSVPTASPRSNSAIDLQAAKRAKTRAQYAAMARQKFGVGTSSVAKTPTAKMKNTIPIPPAGSSAISERTSRTMSRVSVSQPTSRSGSPSSRFSSYSHYLATNGNLSRSRKSSIGNDLSSRETSPNRSLCSPYGFKSRYTQPTRRPLMSQKILQQSREAESELADALGNVGEDSSPFRGQRGLKTVLDDHSDESETSSMCSEHSFDSYRRPSDSMSWNGSQHRLYREMGDLPLKSIEDIIGSCESSHWNDRKRGLISLQYLIQDGHKLELLDLKRIMDIFLKIFNDPHIKVFSLFLDTLNELISSHSSDMCFCLHLLLTRLFNKMGTDLLNSVHSKIVKTLENVFAAFPADLQVQSIFRFVVDPTQTPNTRVKLAALHYLIKLTTVADPGATFSPSNSSKDYASVALNKIIGWAMTDNAKSTPELRKVSSEVILALFNLNPSQVARRFSEMPLEYQETAAAICKIRSQLSNGADEIGNSFDGELHSPSVSNLKVGQSAHKTLLPSSSPSSTFPFTSTANSASFVSFSDLVDSSVKGSRTPLVAESSKFGEAAVKNARMHDHVDVTFSQPQFQTPRPALMPTSVSSSSPSPSSSSPSPDDPQKKNNSVNFTDYNSSMKTCIDQLSQTSDNQTFKKELLIKLMTLVQESPSDVLIAHFKSLLGRIISLMSSSEPPLIKELVLSVLHVIVRRKTIIFLLKQFSDLVITRVIALCGDSSREVVKAAENCAIILSTHLPADSVIRIIVPLITSEAGSVKLIAIKMLTRLVLSADESAIMASIDQIMPVLLVAYEDVESSVRKAAVFCIVALYTKSENARVRVEPHLTKLQGAKLRLVHLYIEKAEQGALFT